MKIRSISLVLASVALSSGFASVPAQATTLAAPVGFQPGAVRTAAGPAALLGVITGFVQGTGGAALTGACVVASGPSGSAMAMTQPGGRYTIASLRPGKYALHFSDCSARGRYLDQWSGGGWLPGSASAVTVTAGQVRQVGRVTLRSTASAVAAGELSGPGLGTGPGLGLGLGAGITPAPGTATTRRAARAGRSATAAGTGAISGKVTGSGKALKGICVVAYRTSQGPATTVRTLASGRYRVGSLRPGLYKVSFSACSRASNWLPQWYPGIAAVLHPRHRPRLVRVTAGMTASGIGAALTLGGEIDGTVRTRSGKALAGICVAVIGNPGPHPVYALETRSGANGQYAAHSLFPAAYKVSFFPGCPNKGNYGPQWWRNASTSSHVTKVPVKGSQVVTKIDAAMPPGAAVTGIVRGGSPTGPRLAGICVWAQDLSKDPVDAITITAKNGSYKLVGLNTGKYRLDYSNCGNHGNYLHARRLVRLTRGRTVSGFDAVMLSGGAISGVVKDSRGDPVSGICVHLTGGHVPSAGTTSGSDGSYSVGALPTGSYTVLFTGGCGNAGSYAPQYYNGQANPATANPVRVTTARTTSGIDAVMQPGATITGVVTDSAGNKLSGVPVCVAAGPAETFGLQYVNVGFTQDGTYAAQNLEPGLYAVNFGCEGRSALAGQWFRSQPDAGRANLVSAPAGAVASGISAELQPGGTITGVVTNRAGQPLPGICVRASLRGSPSPAVPGGLSPTRTDQNGAYRVRNLAAGRYVVQFRECWRGGYGSRWYRHQATPQSGTPVTVTAGGTTPGIDEVLAPAGSISGRVTNRAGKPLAGACVQAVDATTQSSGLAQTNNSGRYTVSGLSTGSYRVSFSLCRSLSSTPRPGLVRVIAPGTVTAVNARFGIAGSISGTVLGTASATPQAGVCVVALAVSPSGSYGYTLTRKGGGYQIRGLTPGKYQVYVGDPFCAAPAAGADNAPQWYKDQPARATAAKVTVSAGADTTGVGATLAPDGGIAGTVTDTGNAPVAGECVTASPVGAVPDLVYGETLRPVIAVTASDGSYSLVDLPPGKYTVEFSAGCGDSGFTTQWWNHAASRSSASVITVSASATVTGVDASLQH